MWLLLLFVLPVALFCCHSSKKSSSQHRQLPSDLLELSACESTRRSRSRSRTKTHTPAAQSAPTTPTTREFDDDLMRKKYNVLAGQLKRKEQLENEARLRKLRNKANKNKKKTSPNKKKKKGDALQSTEEVLKSEGRTGGMAQNTANTQQYSWETQQRTNSTKNTEESRRTGVWSTTGQLRTNTTGGAFSAEKPSVTDGTTGQDNGMTGMSARSLTAGFQL